MFEAFKVQKSWGFIEVPKKFEAFKIQKEFKALKVQKNSSF